MAYLDYLNESVRTPQEELEDLKKANDFSDTDLLCNRSGKLAAGQTSRLIAQIFRPLVRSFLILAGWLLTIVVLASTILAGMHLNSQMHGPAGPVFLERFLLFRGLYIVSFLRIGALIMVISCAGALIIAVITTLVKTIDLIRDLLTGQVATIQGRVYAAEEENRGTPWDALRDQWTRVHQERSKTYRYAIRDVALDVSDAGFRAIASGGHYKLYYTPRSRLLLSIEPVNLP